MLFRTVYGPELIAVYKYLAQANTPISRQTLYEEFMPTRTTTLTVSPQNMDDALAFLQAASLISQEDRFYKTFPIEKPFSPILLILHQLNLLSRQEIEAKNHLDPLYIQILDEIFIKPDRLFVDKMHIEVNKLRQVREVGGLNQEKVQAWKRVMTFLGVGKRVGNGFLCVYTPDLLRAILGEWHEKSASLQQFFENHLTTFLPFKTSSLSLAQAVSEPLLHLAEREELILEAKQDSPHRAYFGEKRFQYITYLGGVTCHSNS